MSKEDNFELWLQFGPRRVGCIRGNDQAREMCDSYNGARYFRRDGVMAAWLVDPQTKQVIHASKASSSNSRVVREVHSILASVYTRRGVDWTKRFPRITQAVRKLPAASILLDGEGVICDGNGLAIFDKLHSKTHDANVVLYAFDLLEAEWRRLPSSPAS
jgi:hypothetical protein